MIFTLSNQFLTLKINSMGAEMVSILDAQDNERLWQADSKIWGRHAPILFPIVGKLKNNHYELNGHQYSMGQHGFARDMEFQLIDKHPDELEFELSANEQTYQYYPYHFSLRIKYRLSGNQVSVEMKVINHDNETMWFSIGAHPGFKIPVSDDESYSDYQIDVQPHHKYEKINLIDSYSDVKHSVLWNLSSPINLSHALFENDAQIFSLNGQLTDVNLTNHHHGVSLMVDNAPYLGIWSAYPNEGDFVCLEPWWGLADDVDSDGQYKDKVAIQQIESQGSFNCGFSFKLF